MSDVPSELKYTKSHEWVREESEGVYVIGITEHAQHLLGDMVFIELPETDSEITAGDEAGVVESVKAASDYYAPISGVVVEVNEALADEPAVVNTDPYGGGWLFKVKASTETELDELLDADVYTNQIAEED